MYVIPIVLLFLILIFIIYFHFKKKSLIKKLKNMSLEEKCSVLNDIAQPFGYCYEPTQDIFSTTIDAWQRKFGFTHAYDVGAPYFNMVYDYQTIYFDYDKKTWLIEIWKGQYGINTGCELGIYHTDTIISPSDYSKALFNAVSDDEMLPLSITLKKQGTCLGTLKQSHWWLTVFDMGMYSHPGKLSVEISITFPDCRMLNAFRSAFSTYMPGTRLNTRGHTASFTFEHCHNKYSLWMRIVRCAALMWCRIFQWFFCFVTRPFKRSGDKILYLYYYMPSAFRKSLRLRRFSKHQK